MIKIHCLVYSRAIRVLWLMEDLGQPYELVSYERNEHFRAPQSLAGSHPLGKSPVIEDGDLMLAESGTILRYLADKFGDASHRPPGGTNAWWRHEEMLDYVEGSFAEVAMPVLLPRYRGKEPSDEAKTVFQVQTDYVTGQLPDGSLLFRDTVTLADIQFSYLLAVLSRTGSLADAPRPEACWAELRKQSGYQAAIDKAGPMASP